MDTRTSKKVLSPRNKLWDYLQEQHELVLLESELDEIISLAVAAHEPPADDAIDYAIGLIEERELSMDDSEGLVLMLRELKARRAAQPPVPVHPFGNGTRESLRNAILSLRLARNNGDADQVRAVLDWLGPDTRSAPTKGAQQFKHSDRVTLIDPPAGCPADGWRVWHLPFSGGGTIYTLLHDDSSTICMPAEGMRLAQGERDDA